MFIIAFTASPLSNRQANTTVSQEVADAIASFSNDIQIVSTMLISLENEIQSNIIVALVAVRFNAESNEDVQCAILFRFASDTRTNTNNLIINFTSDVLAGFGSIINNLRNAKNEV